MPDIELQLARPPPSNRLRRGQETGNGAGDSASRAGRQDVGRDDEDVVGFVIREIAPRLGGDAGRRPPSTGRPRAGANRVPAFRRIDVEEFATLAICPDGDLWPYLEQAVRIGVSVEEIFEELFAPAARRLGAMWDDDDCDFLSVTTGAHRLQIAVRRLSLACRRVREGPARALFCAAPGESHVLGLSMARLAFEQSGWSTEVADGSGLDAAVRRRWFDLVAFSISCDRWIDGLAGAVARVRKVSRNRNVFILAGGAAVAAKPDLAARIGADAIAATAQEAVVVTRSLLRRSERRESGGR